MFKALSIPHVKMLNGIINIPLRNYYLFGFIDDKFTMPAIAMLN
jgi:hypothetical protein